MDNLLCCFIYFCLHAVHGRFPSHFVLRDRQRSQEAHNSGLLEPFPPDDDLVLLLLLDDVDVDVFAILNNLM